jgi:nucleotide-binding universal stress UspA family protein
MPFKDILVLCDKGEANDYRIEMAFSLAKVFDAHVIGVHLIPFPVSGSVYPPYVPISATLQFDVTGKHANNLKERFEKIASNMKISCSWKSMEGSNVDYIIDNGRYTDLVIVPQGYSRYGENEPRRFNEFFATHLGRPLLVVPDLKKVFKFPRKIIVAWDESKEAARAVHDALPLLEFAESIQVVSISKNEKKEKMSMIYCDDLRTHLSHHGLNVEVVSPAQSPKGVGNTLLQNALEFDADLIVMGAYGHSRVKEIILGGTTKFMLDHSKIPLFLSS